MIGWMGGWMGECFLGLEVPRDAIFNSLFSTITAFFFFLDYFPLVFGSCGFRFRFGLLGRFATYSLFGNTLWVMGETDFRKHFPRGLLPLASHFVCGRPLRIFQIGNIICPRRHYVLLDPMPLGPSTEVASPTD